MIPKIDIVQVRWLRGTAWDSRIIETETRAWCSHVEAILPGEQATFGAMLKGGVCRRTFDDPAYKNIERWEIWNIPCTTKQSNAYYSFLFSQNGKPYDWRAIASFAFGERDWQEPDSWFCSEIQMMAACKAGLFHMPKQIPADRITPRDTYLVFTTLPGAWK